MLRSAKDLRGYGLDAEDSTLGSVYDLYFDDELWVVRYLVAKTVAYIGRKVLLAPAALGSPHWSTQTIDVNLTKDQIKSSPGIDLRQPVSQKMSDEINAYYGWPVFEQHDHLRSMREVLGYHIAATDGDIGHLEDLIVDVEQWTLPRIVVDTRNVLPGKKVLLQPTDIDRISWGERSVFVGLTTEQVRGSPTFEASAPVNEAIQTVRTDFRGVPHQSDIDTLL